MGIDFTWDTDIRGNSALIARKSRGKISIAELQAEMSKYYQYEGAWAVIFKASEESGHQGWDSGVDPKGDVLELYRVGDGEECPICTTTFCGVDFCPHCGERIKED
ncbi:MAG: hypothetical protein FWG40_01200 [Peptococcaceae bacterium]|nr:hypothetical protein [Peptococcaceae bacterium]